MEMTSTRKGPTVTAEQLKDHIVGCTYTVLPNGRTTICQLTLKNGYTVEGQAACVDKRNFNKELGEEYSRKEAENKIWPLLGYALASELALVNEADKLEEGEAIFEHGDPKTYIGTKVIHAIAMNRLTYNQLRGWELPEDENGDDPGFLVQYANGQQTNVEGFGGYVSWSPRDVFEESYKEVTSGKSSTYMERMEEERLQLHERLQRLQVFTQSHQFECGLDETEQSDLLNQASAMKLYLEILDRRIDRATK